jgi:hypothetical protein
VYVHLSLSLTARDWSEIVDHSTGDVAYLRISAHVEAKQVRDILSLHPPPVLEPEFEQIYDTVKDSPLYRHGIKVDGDRRSEDILPPTQLVRTGLHTYSTDVIKPTHSSSVEEGIRFCLDRLQRTSYINPTDVRSPERTTSNFPKHNFYGSATEKYVRFLHYQFNLFNLLRLSTSTISGDNLDRHHGERQSFRDRESWSQDWAARPISILLGPCQHWSLFSSYKCKPPNNTYLI